MMQEFAKVRCIRGTDGKRIPNTLTKKQPEIANPMGFAKDDVRPSWSGADANIQVY